MSSIHIIEIPKGEKRVRKYLIIMWIKDMNLHIEDTQQKHLYFKYI